jgi:type VI secretion system secreted protein Hcp
MNEIAKNKMQLGAIFAALFLIGTISVYAVNNTTLSTLAEKQSDKELDLAKLASLPSADAASVDYYLKIEGVDGESTDDRHKGQIDIQSFSWGVSNPSTVGPGSAGSGAGKVNFHDISIMKTVDKASPQLFSKAASGEHMKEVVLTGQMSGENPVQFYQIKMSDVIISSFWQATPEGQIPMESVSFDFAKIEIEYMPMSADGTSGEAIKAGWDLKTNVKV